MYSACHKIGSPSAAPATQSTLQVHQALHLPRYLRSATRGPAAPTRAAADPRRLCLPQNLHSRFTKRCACHEICTRPHAAQPRPSAPQLIQEALCTAPATKSTLQAHQVLRLPQNLHSRFTKCYACHQICTQPRATQRCARAPQLIQEALCTAPATKSALQAHQV